MIAVVDYGLGNIRAFVNIFRRLNIDVSVATSGADLAGADKIVLPGVGAFDWAMEQLDGSGLRAPLDAAVLLRKVPVLGVCVGMQMMAARSEEGKLPGLGWIDGEVVRFEPETGGERRFDLPHMGWNDVAPTSRACLFAGLDDVRSYFLHSYCLRPSDPAITLAETEYAGRFTSAIRAGHIFATQFHPEKSHHWGIAVLRNFALL